MYLMLRILRGLCGLFAAWHAFGFALLAITPTASLDGRVFPTILLILTLLAGWLFFWLRGVINRLYAKHHAGAPHPALHSAWSL